jgi:hypothetical protein
MSIILVAPNAAVFLVHGTGFITPRAPKSSPQLKQNPWFERFTELGQIKNVPMGQNLEGKDHYEDAEGDLEAVHFRGKYREDGFRVGPISVCYRFGRPFGRRAAFAGFRTEPRAESAFQSRAAAHCVL